ncbi:MAG: universal stress protein [Alphaproteobacteria bacterium]|nr:universal stress protein [Alphaproteobacteria bacterium]
MIRTIVTPIDGSTHAQSALDLSTDLAARYDAQLVLLHVGVRDGNVPEELHETASRELEAAESKGQETGVRPQQSKHLQTLEYMGRMLLRSAQERAEGKGVKRVETVFDVGDASEQILHHAKERAADLIVMGSRGLGELEGLVLGSVSHSVFHLAPCSCVTVNRRDARSPLEGIKSILVPTDGSDQADRAVNLASEIAGKYGAKLVLLYAMWRGPSLEQLRASIDMDQLSESAREELDPARHPIAEHISSSFIAPVVSRDTLKEIGELVLARGQQTAEARGVRAPKLLLRDGDPARMIVNIARREHADLIAMGSRGLGGGERLLAGSVSYKVNHTAPCSCMIVR